MLIDHADALGRMTIVCVRVLKGSQTTAPPIMLVVRAVNDNAGLEASNENESMLSWMPWSPTQPASKILIDIVVTTTGVRNSFRKRRT